MAIATAWRITAKMLGAVDAKWQAGFGNAGSSCNAASRTTAKFMLACGLQLLMLGLLLTRAVMNPYLGL